MNHCNECAVKTLRYLAHDLKGLELDEFLAHIESCSSCRAHLEGERELSATLHRSRPLYSAPIALRDRVAAAARENAALNRAQDSIYRHASPTLGNRLSGALQSLASWRVLAPVAIAIAVCLAFVPNVDRRVQAASYVETAVARHRSYLNGDLHPELESSSPEQVAAWFAGKVPFDFRLPAAESAPERNAYRLTGASLVNYKGSPAALVTYATRNEKISLLVDSSKSAVVAGGSEVRFGKLTFHYYNHSGFRVITWNNHGLAYALVSSVSGPASASCLVCHQSMTDSSNFKVHR
jgi:hypothetical protein